MNLSLILKQSAERLPAKTVLFYNGSEISYAQLLDLAARFAGGLKKLGIKKGDRVAIALSNRPEFIIAYFGILYAGGIAVTLNAFATAYELTHYLADSRSKVLITNSHKAALWPELRKRVTTRKIIVVDAGENSLSFDHLTASCAPLPEPVETEGDDPAAILYTSAMKGVPLGAVLSHNNLLTNAEAIRTVEGIDENDRSIAVIPLFHAFGATVNMLSMIKYGGSIVLMERFEIQRLFELIEKKRATYLAGVPLIFMSMLAYPKANDYNIKSLWLCFTGGCAPAPGMIPQFQKRFKSAVMDGYGLTEAAPIVSSSEVRGLIKTGSVGPPIPGCSIKITDDSGAECPCGKTGEVLTSGPNIMLGYFEKPKETEAIMENGWLHTGDLGYVDEDGLLFLTGRKKHMLITNGLNIYPKEVEKVLAMHPGIKKAMVTGKPDPVKSEIAYALVVAEPGSPPGEKDIIKHARMYLAPYKVPRKILFVNEIPEDNETISELISGV